MELKFIFISSSIEGLFGLTKEGTIYWYGTNGWVVHDMELKEEK